MIEWIINFLKANEFASGGFLIMMLGSIGATLYKIIPITFQFVKRNIIVTIEVPSYDESFEWFNKWLANLDYSKKSRLLTASSKYVQADRPKGSSELKPQLFFSPAPGNHFFKYKGKLVWIHREREKLNTTGSQGLMLYESFVITMMAKNKDIAQQMLTDARDYIFNLEKNRTVVYTNDDYGNWEKIHSQKRRKLNTIILKDDMQYNLVKDIKEFFNKESWYNKMGIPYRRGYLLHGLPGTGKTSLIKGIAGVFNLPIYILNISTELTEGNFQKAIINIPEKSILLMEDIDAVFEKRNKSESEQKVSFKTLLNAIDGIISPYGTVLFMTTNYRDKLDSALIRPGRIDKEYGINKVDKLQAEKLFRLFYPSSNGHAKKFARNIKSNKYTPAELQKYFICRPNMNTALKQINKIKENKK